MKLLGKFTAVLLVLAFTFACTTKKKEMTIEDFGKIDSEIALPEPSLDPQKVDKVAEKYGYTGNQYRAFFDKVQKDIKLQQKLGEFRLNSDKKK